MGRSKTIGCRNSIAKLFKDVPRPFRFDDRIIEDMEKEFDRWNEQKKALEESSQDILFKQGEVWWCAVGTNVANESCGKGEFFGRPVLVLRKLSHDSCIGIPLSTKKKEGSWFVGVQVQGKMVTALLYQIRMFSAYRFQRRLTTLSVEDFQCVKEKLEALLELS